MNLKETKTRYIIYLAYDKGYRISEDGTLYALKSTSKPKRYGKQKYPTFSVNIGNNKNYGIPFHMFASYCFYGDASFEEGIVVRHLDGDTENCSMKNIVLGTHSQNNMDKPKAIRIYAAKKARASQGHPKNRKLAYLDAQEIRVLYKNGTKVSEIVEKYKISKVTCYSIIREEIYND